MQTETHLGIPIDAKKISHNIVNNIASTELVHLCECACMRVHARVCACVFGANQTVMLSFQFRTGRHLRRTLHTHAKLSIYDQQPTVQSSECCDSRQEDVSK